jgi:hypothetical protein
MTPDQWWWLGLGIGAVVVAVVALLLGLIILAARSIDEHAKEIWTVGKQIAGNTAAVWTFTQIAGTTPKVRRAADSLEESGRAIAEAVGVDSGDRAETEREGGPG